MFDIKFKEKLFVIVEKMHAKKKEILKQGLYQHYGLYPGRSWHIQQIILWYEFFIRCTLQKHSTRNAPCVKSVYRDLSIMCRISEEVVAIFHGFERSRPVIKVNNELFISSFLLEVHKAIERASRFTHKFTCNYDYQFLILQFLTILATNFFFLLKFLGVKILKEAKLSLMEC